MRYQKVIGMVIFLAKQLSNEHNITLGLEAHMIL